MLSGLCRCQEGRPVHGQSTEHYGPSDAQVGESFVYGRHEGVLCRCSERSREDSALTPTLRERWM